MKHMFLRLCCIIFLVALSANPLFARGNLDGTPYQKAKKILYSRIYHDHRYTLYCNFPYEENRFVALPPSFSIPAYPERANRVETEHVVPVENFGRTFREWREGDSACVSSSGKPFKGRRCAERMNEEFRQMEADLYNLYPAVGVVNAVRGNSNFQMLGSFAPMPFGAVCPVRMEKRRVEPPEHARGTIARTYLYMEATYERFRMSQQQRRLMEAWDRQYPPSSWECERARRIKAIQGNSNMFVERQCR